MSDSTRHVAIVGGGFSGAALASRLAESGIAATLIDRTGAFGLGVAYSTTFDGHVLNVRANRMSAIEGRPDDFVTWLEAHHPDHADPEGFAPRRLYGHYVQDRLAGAETAHPRLITRVVGEAVALDGATVGLADGRVVEAEAVVLATGNPTPNTADLARDGQAARVIGDPWALGALEGVGPDDDLVILGSGLTMADVVLALSANGWRGSATALSRRGLSPRSHRDQPDSPSRPTEALLSGPLSKRLAEARRLATTAGWRRVMEGLRSVTADLWATADAATRARFLRHLRPWWDVHRHRIAAPVEERLAAMRTEGRLRTVAGRLREIAVDQNGVTVAWRPRGGGDAPPLTGRWLIDCTGPGYDPAAEPLTGNLVRNGRARLDPLCLGVELDQHGRTVPTAGTEAAPVFVLGPPARGAYWETTAVPDIRKRIESLVLALKGSERP